MVLQLTGKRAPELLANEPGGHRFQRIPPTERRGRVHTSTITIAVMLVPEPGAFKISQDDLLVKATRGSGPGGQNRNKVSSAVIITHLPTGTTVRCESERSQHQNKQLALSLLSARLADAEKQSRIAQQNSSRKSQVGSGMRGDKRRTYRLQADQVSDHITGKRSTWARIARGNLDDLFPG